MQAHKIKTAIETLLEAHSAGKFQVASLRRKTEADSIFTLPMVQVNYADGSFDKSKSSVNSPYHHDITFNIYLQTAAKARLSLAVLQNPAASEKQYEEALSAAGNAQADVDGKTDELISLLFDILMRPENRDLGTGTNTDRWVASIKKNNPETTGSIVLQSAALTLSASCVEEATGEQGTPGASVEAGVNEG